MLKLLLKFLYCVFSSYLWRSCSDTVCSHLTLPHMQHWKSLPGFVPVFVFILLMPGTPQCLVIFQQEVICILLGNLSCIVFFFPSGLYFYQVYRVWRTSVSIHPCIVMRETNSVFVYLKVGLFCFSLGVEYWIVFLKYLKDISTSHPASVLKTWIQCILPLLFLWFVSFFSCM